MTLVGMIGVMFYLNWQFTLIALSVAPVSVCRWSTAIRGEIKKASRAVRKKEGEIISVVEEVLSSIRVVKAFAREDFEVHRLEKRALRPSRSSLRARALKARLAPMVRSYRRSRHGPDALVRRSPVIDGQRFQRASLVVFILYLGKMYKPMQELSKMTDTYSKAAVGYERIQRSPRHGRRSQRLPARRSRSAPSRVISTSTMYPFDYASGLPSLEDVSFTIEPGQIAALGGPTGPARPASSA